MCDMFALRVYELFGVPWCSRAALALFEKNEVNESSPFASSLCRSVTLSNHRNPNLTQSNLTCSNLAPQAME